MREPSCAPSCRSCAGATRGSDLHHHHSITPPSVTLLPARFQSFLRGTLHILRSPFLQIPHTEGFLLLLLFASVRLAPLKVLGGVDAVPTHRALSRRKPQPANTGTDFISHTPAAMLPAYRGGRTGTQLNCGHSVETKLTEPRRNTRTKRHAGH